MQMYELQYYDSESIRFSNSDKFYLKKTLGSNVIEMLKVLPID
jgi:hypothetical protein